MKKFFNVSGPCNPDEHYMLSTLKRCEDLHHLIERQQYFEINAPHQSGKTTFLLELAREVKNSWASHAVYCSLGVVEGIGDPEQGIPLIVAELQRIIANHPILKKYPFAEDVDPYFTEYLRASLTYFCQTLDTPLVILFGDIDYLSNGTLRCFLGQLRTGFNTRYSIPFPSSIVFAGRQRIWHYQAKLLPDNPNLVPFNILTSSEMLPDFTQAEVAALYMQHTKETGQKFPTEVINTIYQHTQGQPWLVNAVACEIIEHMLNADYARLISVAHVEQAMQAIALRYHTKIDRLPEFFNGE